MTFENKAGGSVAVDGLKTRQRADRQRPIGIVGFFAQGEADGAEGAQINFN